MVFKTQSLDKRVPEPEIQSVDEIDPSTTFFCSQCGKKNKFFHGYCYYCGEKLDEAIRHLSVVVRLRPDDAEAHYALGTALARQKKLDQAVSHWLKVADLDPNNANVRYSIGKAMVQQGKLDEAIVHWSEAVNLEPNNIAVRYNLGIALAKVEQHDQAIAHWLRLLKFEPDNVGALMNIAASYAETGQLDQAVASLEKALDIARSASNEQLARSIGEQIELYRRNRPQDNARQRGGGR